MATILLGSVGFALGGPIGAAIGSIAGKALDQAVFGGPRRAEGPRLKELDVQTSSYGTEIPAIFGAMRVAGTVIWATDLIESKGSEGGGKSGPGRTTYSYAVSLAVALSSRPALRVGRIWADGNLLRGAAGDFKLATGFRFYTGHGDQPVDPLIAQAEGVQASAFRGLAYAMFEDLPLADFGNRIPSLSFELFERGGSVRLVDVARAVSGGVVGGEDAQAVAGFAAGGTERDMIDLMMQAGGLSLRRTANSAKDKTENGSGLVLSSAPLEAFTAPEPVAAIDGRAVDRPARTRSPLGDRPVTVALRYYEPARDYQAGLQRARRTGPGRGEASIDFPAAIDAAEARGLAEILARRAVQGAQRLSLTLPAGSARPRAGTAFDHDGVRWEVSEIEYRRGALAVGARLCAQGSMGEEGTMTPPTAAAGRALRETDAPIGPTTLLLVELSDLTAIGADRPIVAVAAAGAGAGWRRAALLIGNARGALRPVGETAPAAIIGTLSAALPAAGGGLIDRANTAEIALLQAGMQLADADRDALFTGANTAWIGAGSDGEIVQFERALRSGPAAYRLSGLRRGVFGTARNAPHALGARFLLLERDRLQPIEAPEVAAGLPLYLAALGVGDALAVRADLVPTGLATLPLLPVRLRADRVEDGALQLSWIRRTRLRADWALTVEPPIGEEGEAYRLTISPIGGAPLRTIETNAPVHRIAAADLAELSAAAQGALHMGVVQLGRFGASPAATLIFS